MITISTYQNSIVKRGFDILVALVMIMLMFVPMLGISAICLILNGWPIFFCQYRLGRKKRSFILFKFRTMYRGADIDQQKYLVMNEANGPVFKIRNDPRYVRFGRFLSHSGLDELPQLLNVLLGQMSIVGPRPLPLKEAAEVIKEYPWRTQVKPGIFSSWIIKGSHSLSFQAWMDLDRRYIQDGSIVQDVFIVLKTLGKLYSRYTDGRNLGRGYF